MMSTSSTIATLMAGLILCGSCFSQETEWQSFRKKVSENAQKIRQLDAGSDVRAIDLLFIDSSKYRLVSPSVFVGSLPSDFGLEALMMFANICPELLPRFDMGMARAAESDPELREWHEEASRLICYRIVSDHRFRDSYLRLGAWNAPSFILKKHRSVGPVHIAHELVKPDVYTATSKTFWILTKELVSSALTTGYEEVLHCELDRGRLVTEAQSYLEFVRSNSFVSSNDLSGWRPSEQANIGGALGKGAEPRLPDSPIADLPSCLKPDLPLINALMY